MPLDRQKHGETQSKTQRYAVGIWQNETKNTTSENLNTQCKEKARNGVLFSCMGLLVLFLYVELSFCLVAFC